MILLFIYFTSIISLSAFEQDDNAIYKIQNDILQSYCNQTILKNITDSKKRVVLLQKQLKTNTYTQKEKYWAKDFKDINNLILPLACDFIIHKNNSSMTKSSTLLYYWQKEYEAKVLQHKTNHSLYIYNSANIRKAASLLLNYLPYTQKKNLQYILEHDLRFSELTTPTKNLNNFLYQTDYLRNYAESLLSYIIYNKPKYLPYFQKYIENFLTPTPANQDGLKPDGLGFHHKMHYNAYMTAYSPLIDILTYLTQTSYQISKEKYLFFRDAIYNMSLMCMGTEELPSIGGRHPFYTYFPISKNKIDTLIQTGGSILHTNIDKKLASMAYRLWKDKKYAPYFHKSFAEGFWQFNFGCLGLYRQKNWLIGFHGFNHALKGGEIDPLSSGKNMFGRYQAYGTAEVLYEGGKKNSGFPANSPVRNPDDPSLDLSDPDDMGWDWNKWPGTTTILLPWHKLLAIPKPSKQTIEENLKNFAGALATKDRKIGIFTMDFQQSEKYQKNHTTTFTFKKTYFAFDGIVVALGSDINNNDQNNNTITTLFQTKLNKQHNTVQTSEGNITQFPYTHVWSDAKGKWLIDPYKTGYIIKSDNKLILTHKKQKTPNRIETKLPIQNFTSGDYATAWLDHDTAPKDEKYHYIIVPDATPQILKKLKNNPPYKILRHDNRAHILQINQKTMAYAFFTKLQNISSGTINSVDKPLLIITTQASNNLTLTVVDPNLEKELEKKNISTQEHTVKIIINGNWILQHANTKIKNILYNQNKTTITFFTKDAKAIYLDFDIHISKSK